MHQHPVELHMQITMLRWQRVVNFPSKSASHHWLTIGVTSTELKRPHIRPSFRFWEDEDVIVSYNSPGTFKCVNIRPWLSIQQRSSYLRKCLSQLFFTSYLRRKSQSPSSQGIFGIHHASDPEERDRKSKTLKPLRFSSETASGHSSPTKAMQVSYIQLNKTEV